MAKSAKKKVPSASSGVVETSGFVAIVDSPTDEEVMPQIPAIDLPVFEGSSHPWLWVRKCETFFSLYRIPTSQRVSFASLHLRGKAETWFDCMMQEKIKKQLNGDICWEDFTRELCYRFGVAEHLELLKEFKSLNQYFGSVQAYHDKFEELLSLVISMFPWYDCDQIVSRYIAGLTKTIRCRVKKRSPTTLARAFELAKFYESSASNEEDGEKICVISPQAMNIKEMDENGNPVVFIQSLKPTTKMATWIAYGITLPSKRPMTVMYDSWTTHSFIDPNLAEECGFSIRKSEPVHISSDLGELRVVSDSVCRGFTWELNGHRCVHDMRVLKLKGGLDMILGTDIHAVLPVLEFGADGNGNRRVRFGHDTEFDSD